MSGDRLEQLGIYFLVGLVALVALGIVAVAVSGTIALWNGREVPDGAAFAMVVFWGPIASTIVGAIIVVSAKAALSWGD